MRPETNLSSIERLMSKIKPNYLNEYEKVAFMLQDFEL